ncbi:protein kinase [Pendulispora albinea]|uniref:Protein kinase n=2 Tax=Pendulispora albinea TaxID=2741071 RepID=A0ABZ2M366_9BACT
MGEVYAVRDLHLDKDFALKTITLKDERGLPRPWQVLAPRFELEARLGARLRDPKSLHDGRDRILTVLNYDFMADGRPFAVMDLLEGWSLGEYLKIHERLPFVTACRIGRDVCLAIAFLHEQGVLHRDVKALNVFLEPGAEMRARLMDLGVATFYPAPDGQKLTSQGGLVGTHGYIPRETYFGEPDEPSRDLFALGVLIFEMVTGQRPWAKHGPNALREIILKDNPPDAPRLTEFIPNYGDAEHYFARQVERLLSHDPRKRTDAATMAVACERAERAVASRQAPIVIEATVEDESLALTSTMQKRAAAVAAKANQDRLPSIIVPGSDPVIEARHQLASMSTARESVEGPPASVPREVRNAMGLVSAVAPTEPSPVAAASLPTAVDANRSRPVAGGQTPMPMSRTVDPTPDLAREHRVREAPVCDEEMARRLLGQGLEGPAHEEGAVPEPQRGRSWGWRIAGGVAAAVTSFVVVGLVTGTLGHLFATRSASPPMVAAPAPAAPVPVRAEASAAAPSPTLEAAEWPAAVADAAVGQPALAVASAAAVASAPTVAPALATTEKEPSPKKAAEPPKIVEIPKTSVATRPSASSKAARAKKVPTRVEDLESGLDGP